MHSNFGLCTETLKINVDVIQTYSVRVNTYIDNNSPQNFFIVAPESGYI